MLIDNINPLTKTRLHWMGVAVRQIESIIISDAVYIGNGANKTSKIFLCIAFWI